MRTDRRTRSTTLSVLLGVAMLGVPPAARSDDAQPADVPTTSSSNEDDALLRSLLGDNPVEVSGDPAKRPDSETTVTPKASAPGESLAATVERMRRAGRRIGDERDTGDETRALQQRAVADLAQLLELARQQQRQRSSNPPPPRPRDSPQRPPEEEPMPDEGSAEPRPMDEQGGEPGTSSGEQRRADDSEATESSNVTGPADDRAARLDERRSLVKDVWGHLPPAERERMLNAYTDAPLPKYEALVRAYFRALAERSRERRPGAGRPRDE